MVVAERRHKGTAHASNLWVVSGRIQNLKVSLFKRFAKGRDALCRIQSEVPNNRLNRQIGCYFAGLRTAHPVGNNIQSNIVRKPKDIFVVVSYTADIRQAESVQHKEKMPN